MPAHTDIGIYALGDCRIIYCVIAGGHAVDKVLMRRVYAGIQHGNTHRVKGAETRLVRHFPHSIEERRRYISIADSRVGGCGSEILGYTRRLKCVVIGYRLNVRHFFIAYGFLIGAVHQQHIAAELPSAVYRPEYLQRTCT